MPKKGVQTKSPANLSAKPRRPAQPAAQNRASPNRNPRRQVAVAAAYSEGQHTGSPMVSASAKRARIVHRELVTSVVGTAAFTVAQSLALNPGIATTFPWLATQAQGWESYRFNKLRFCYYTRTGSTTPGSVMLIPEYDASDASPVSEQVASTYEDTEEDVPWKDICCTLSANSMFSQGPRKFVRTGSLSANQDIKLYDAGVLHLATVDGTAVPWGKLWVEYDVEFDTPQLPPDGGAISSGGKVVGSGSLSAAAPLGSGANVDASSSGFSVSGQVITFSQPGTYLISAILAGTGITAFDFALSAGLSLLTNFGSTINSASNQATITKAVLVPLASPQAVATLTFSATASTVTASFVMIANAPNGSLA